MSPRPTSLKVSLLACLCVLLAAGRAWALSSDKNQPINIHADHADFKADPKNASDGIGIYTGHVVITQGSIVLHADKAVLHVINNDLSSADVTGDPATFVQQPDVGEPMHGESQEITYDAARNEMTLITNAKLTQQVLAQASNANNVSNANNAKGATGTPGERLMTADVIHYNTDTQHVIAKSGDESQRVHMSFPPKTAAPASSTVIKPGKGRKSITLPPAGARVPTTLGAPPQSTAPAATSAPAAATQPGHEL